MERAIPRLARLIASLKRIVHFLGAVADSACPHADGNLRRVGEKFLQPSLTERLKCGSVDDLHAFFLLFEIPLRASAVRAVVMLLWMTPSMATTGASAHWPKQATVEIVN